LALGEVEEILAPRHPAPQAEPEGAGET
jgi:hypothetical protein